MNKLFAMCVIFSDIDRMNNAIFTGAKKRMRHLRLHAYFVNSSVVSCYQRRSL